MYDAGPFNWVGRNIEYVLALLDSSKQIFPRVNFNSTNGVTRANVPQTTLAIDSGATIHFFSNPELLKLIREIINKFTVHCGGNLSNTVQWVRSVMILDTFLSQRGKSVYFGMVLLTCYQCQSL